MPLLSSSFFVTCSHSDFYVSSHITLHRAQMSHVQKKKSLCEHATNSSARDDRAGLVT